MSDIVEALPSTRVDGNRAGPRPEPSGTAEHNGAAVPMVRLLDRHGVRLQDETYGPWAEHLGAAELAGLYRDMVLTRRFDAEATALQRQGELGLWVQSLGQEAAQIGSGRALAAHDYVFPSYREHGVVHTRGIDLTELLPLFRGTDHGGWDTRKYNCHLYTLVIGSQTLHAAGYAMGVNFDHAVGTGDPARDTAVIGYFGDGATSQGDVSEAMSFAAVYNAPLVFFCTNNQWAISEPTDRQSRVPLYQRGAGFGIPGVRVDGNDVLACYAVTRAALERARSGGGPVLIEAYTYRMGAHTTSDDPTRYRTRDQEQFWRERDPIDRLRLHLTRENLVSEHFLAEVEVEADALGERVRTVCRSLPEPVLADAYRHVYATPHAQVPAVEATR